MTFDEILGQSIEMLQRRGRVSYGALKRQFALDDEYLADLKVELIEVLEVATDQDGKMLVWKGMPSEQHAGNEEQLQVGESALLRFTPAAPSKEAERRQLTVLFCDLVGSTTLSAQLDPEDYRAIVRQYQQTCTEVIQRYEGYLAQYLGDGLLVYFGYPIAHEDDARRAVRTGLEIVEALKGQARQQPLQARIGVHTGLVVVGEIGSNDKRELLALGETPNIAARIQGLAEPNTVMISAATQRLIAELFESQPFGSHLVKGIEAPITVYHVQSERQSPSPLARRSTLTPLVGRDQEVGLLFDRWEQAKDGHGQVVLLSGEPGIGKSRLAYTLKQHVANDGYLLIESRCSPYHQHSALYPLIEFLQRVLFPMRQETDQEKVGKLEHALALYGMQETVPLFTALLSLPTPSLYPPLNLTPQQQKERTLQAAVQWLVAQAERQATVSVWEDLHWADPSSLEFLTLLVEQIPTTKLLLVVTFRPEFTPPWKLRSHISHLVINRLGRKQVATMIEQVSGQEVLSAEVLQQIVTKADGVPLFVEELTKSVFETVTAIGAAPLQVLTIPATLQEALLARLDRLSTARQIAQIGATLGREFSYELLHAVARMNETNLQAALVKLVEAEILYQRGIGQQARYFFKHALIQDTAYQSLLKSTRQHYHQQIARVLEERFPETKTNQPELLAHHYTEAVLIEQAIPYWQQAGERATQRSANVEALSHLAKGLELLKALPDTSVRAQQELRIRIALSAPLVITKGFAAPEVERTYERAHELCQQLGETPEFFRVLAGLWMFRLCGNYELQTARELAEQLLQLAQHEHDSAHLRLALPALGSTLFYMGELPTAREHFEKEMALHDAASYDLIDLFGVDSGTQTFAYAALTLWLLGFPDQALKYNTTALSEAQERSRSFDLATELEFAAVFHVLCREAHLVQERSEAALPLSTEPGFSQHLLAWGSMHQGWALWEQGHHKSGIDLFQKGLSLFRSVALPVWMPFYLGLLAELYGKDGQAEAGLSILAEAFEVSSKKGARWYEAELYRLKGELTLNQCGVRGSEFDLPSPQPLTPSTQAEAEACFLKAIEVARKQQAKSWELRAATSLARLWQQQGKRAEAHKLLSEIYHWFTEGFDTKDLQEAKVLLEELH